MSTAAPLRIRVASHPPLPPLKAWLPIPSPPATVAELELSIRRLLGGAEVELELLGFSLVRESSCSILDPTNDVIDVKAPPSHTSRPHPSISEPSYSAPRLPTPALSASIMTAKSISQPSSSSSDSSSDSDSDSDDDSEPEVQSTKLAVSATHRVATQPPPSKRPKLSSSSSSDSSSSSSDSSSSSSSDSDSDAPTTKAQRVPVLPGRGKRETQKRNARRRLLRAVKNGDPPASTEKAPVMVMASTEAKKAAVDPYLDYDRASKEAKKQGKKKTFLSQPQPVPSSASANGSLSPMQISHSGEPSPSFTPSSPTSYFPPLPSSSTKKKRPDKGKGKEMNRHPHPSERTDLPASVVVTKVDVEADGWVAGVGEVVRGTDRDWKGWEEKIEPVKAAVEEMEGEWRGCQRLVWVEENWETLRVLTKVDAMKGDKVAIKVLELDPTTFSPVLSTKYGSLQSLSPFRIKLHPDCISDPESEEEEEWEETEEWKKPKFGEPLGLDEEEDTERSEWEGEWGDVRVVI